MPTLSNRPPRTIRLGGPWTSVDEHKALAAITPGMLVEYVNDAGTLKVQAHSTAGGDAVSMVAFQRSEFNQAVSLDPATAPVDPAYAVDDEVKTGVGANGATAWMILPTGQTINPGDGLESNGDGKLRALAAGTKIATALGSSGGATAADRRIEVELVVVPRHFGFVHEWDSGPSLRWRWQP